MSSLKDMLEKSIEHCERIDCSPQKGEPSVLPSGIGSKIDTFFRGDPPKAKMAQKETRQSVQKQIDAFETKHKNDPGDVFVVRGDISHLDLSGMRFPERTDFSRVASTLRYVKLNDCSLVKALFPESLLKVGPVSLKGADLTGARIGLRSPEQTKALVLRAGGKDNYPQNSAQDFAIVRD